MSLVLYPILFLAAFLIALFTLPFLRDVAPSLGLVDRPGRIKVHREPIPRVGGLSLYLSFLVPFVLFLLLSSLLSRLWMGIIVGLMVVGIVGFLDDLFGISPWLKLTGHFIAVAFPLSAGLVIPLFTNHLLSIIFTLFYFLGVINASNLIDGLDGLAGGCGLVASLWFLLIFILRGSFIATACSVTLAGGILAFLRFNFYPAKLFMGDTGSYFLGFSLATLGVLSIGEVNIPSRLLGSILIIWIPIYDTALTILRRFFHHLPLGQGDLGHFYNRIMEEKRLGQKKTVLILWGIAFSLAGVGVLVTKLSTFRAIIVFTFVAILSALAALKYNFLRKSK